MVKCKDLTAKWKHERVYQITNNDEMYGVRRATKYTQMEADTS